MKRDFLSVTGLRLPVHCKIHAVLLGQFLSQFYPMRCQKHSMTPLAENYEDDSQYSSLALPCMRENMSFSRQLLQITIAPVSPTGILVLFLFHAVSLWDGNLLAELFCVPSAVQCLLLSPPLCHHFAFIASPGFLQICNRIQCFSCSVPSPLLGNNDYLLVLGNPRPFNIFITNWNSKFLKK